MNDRDDRELVAFEYVLGTLDDGERVAVSARRRRDDDLDAAITYWERTLTPLVALGDSTEPPADLFARIASRLDAPGARPTIAPTEDTSTEFDRLRRRLSRWRASAIAAYAVAAGLVVITTLGEVFHSPQPPTSQRQFVAVFNDGDTPPAFLLTIDLSTRELTIRPVTAGPRAGKTYELWIASDRIDDSPRSLGVIGDATSPSRKRLTDFDPDLLQGATFGISLEPEGGSTAGRPTGPALHGTLLPATN